MGYKTTDPRYPVVETISPKDRLFGTLENGSNRNFSPTAIAQFATDYLAKQANPLPQYATPAQVAQSITQVQQSLAALQQAQQSLVTASQLQQSLTTKQDADSDLSAIAALATQPFGRSLLTGDSAASVRGILDVPNSASVTDALNQKQPLDDDLTAIATLSTQPFGRSLLTGDSAASVRSLLDVPNSASVTDALNQKQPLDSDLTAIAALATQPFGRSLLTGDSAASVRGILDVPNSASVTDALNQKQPLDSDLTAIAALATQPFGRNLLTSADVSTSRQQLEILPSDQVGLNSFPITLQSPQVASPIWGVNGTKAALQLNGTGIDEAAGKIVPILNLNAYNRFRPEGSTPYKAAWAIYFGANYPTMLVNWQDLNNSQLTRFQVQTSKSSGGYNSGLVVWENGGISVGYGSTANNNAPLTSDAPPADGLYVKGQVKATGGIFVETAIGSTLLNAWANYGSGMESVQYFKTPAGIVHVKGVAKSGTIGQSIFTLPSGYRPAGTYPFLCHSNNGVADVMSEVQVRSDGSVVPVSGSNIRLSLSGIIFRAVQ
ncbi:MAG TPA: hypothetical protein V6D33_12620 [Cyanophyceae cyanobacterium]